MCAARETRKLLYSVWPSTVTNNFASFCLREKREWKLAGVVRGAFQDVISSATKAVDY